MTKCDVCGGTGKLNFGGAEFCVDCFNIMISGIDEKSEPKSRTEKLRQKYVPKKP